MLKAVIARLRLGLEGERLLLDLVCEAKSEF